jgi:hypothetical protein
MSSHRVVGDNGDLFTLAEWREAVTAGMFNHFDGSGSWVKDGAYMTGFVFDDVFGPVPEGATHVEWYNK